MKISGNSRSKKVSKTGASRTKKASTGGKALQSRDADSIDISPEAMMAAGADEVAPVVAVEETTTDGPLPDPYETSKKMLEKELRLVFKDTYLTDGV